MVFSNQIGVVRGGGRAVPKKKQKQKKLKRCFEQVLWTGAWPSVARETLEKIACHDLRISCFFQTSLVCLPGQWDRVQTSAIYLTINPPSCLFIFYIYYIYLSIYLSTYQFMYPSINQPIYLSEYLVIYINILRSRCVEQVLWTGAWPSVWRCY